MSLKKEMSTAVTANWAGTFCSFLLAFVATPIIVHSFGNARYGVWSIAMSLTGYYGIIDIGIRTTIIKFIAEYNEKKEHLAANTLVNTTLSLYFMIIPIIAIIVAFVSYNVENIFNIEKELIPETKILLYIIGLNFCVATVGNVFRAIIVGLRKFVFSNWTDSLFSIARNACIIVVLKSGYGLVATAVTVLVIDLLFNVTSVFFAFRFCPYLKISFSLINYQALKGTYIFAFFNFLRQMSIRITERSPIIIIGIMLDMKTVAFYSIAESLIRYLARIPKGLRGIILPFSSALYANEEQGKLQKMATILPKYTMSFFMGVLLISALFGRQFIELWMGEGYDLSYKILLILILAKAVSMSQSMLVHLVVGTGNNRFYGMIGLIEMTINITACVVLSKIFGVYGIALAILLSVTIVSGIFEPVYSTRQVKISTAQYYFHVVFIPMAIFGILFTVNFVILKITSFLWVPIVVAEFIILNYFLVWTELKFKNKKFTVEV